MTVHHVSSGYPDSNIYLLKGDRNVLIDTGTGISSSSVIDSLRGFLQGESLHSVILTHCHVDHVGGLGRILDEFGSEAFALPPDSQRIRDADPDYTLSDMFSIPIDPQPVTDLEDLQTIDIGEHRLRIIATPGHTEGGLCVYDEVTQSLFSGDTVFLNGVGRTDFPSGDFDALRKSVCRISNIDIMGMYPGHGDCIEERGNDFVQRALRLVGEFN